MQTKVMTPLTPHELHFQSPSPPVQSTGNNEHPAMPGTGDDPSWELFIGNTIGGLKPGEVLDLAAQLDVGSAMYSMDM
ncbi:hypothetical protein BJY04DRAFT_172970 [Aspergillus karnatakaensis]|uniref:uncharacterized protein n=1 Tax=Aspergillus karnatakaensis TaxID=1810916 RepID=UPI003CCDD41C